MSRGKYSPICPRGKEFIYNCFKQLPEPYDRNYPETYDAQKHFANYDDEGFDSYGYSAWGNNGEYVGVGSGIDRLGYTEFDYLTMDDDDWFALQWSINR